MPPNSSLDAQKEVFLHAYRQWRRGFWLILNRCPRCHGKLERMMLKATFTWGMHPRTGRVCKKRCTFISDVRLVDADPPPFTPEDLDGYA